MRALRRRAIGCAAAAATGAVLLAAASAQAQRPEKTGDGIPTGQMSVQMFNYGGYMNNGGGLGATPPALGISAGCVTSTSSDCRWERLERLFAFLQRKGVTGIELFGHSNFPASTDIAGLVRYRALMDQYGIHAGGWHGSMNEAQWDTRVAAAKILGADFIGSGGVADPGINTYGATLLSAQALNRLGKKSVEAGVGPAYIHNHTDEFDRKYVDDGVEKTAFQIIMERTDPRYVASELDVFWSSDAFDDVTGTASKALIDAYPTRIQLLHIKDGVSIEARGSGISSRGGSPRATGTGELDFRPIFQAAKDRVRYYHQEQDGGTLTDADISFTNLKGIGPASVGTLLALPPTFASVAANTPAASNVTPMVVQNTGDQPLTITNIQVQGTDAADFSVVSQNCTAAGGGGPLAPGVVATGVPRGTCVVNVGFKPTRAGYTSVANLRFTSNSDTATESVLLAARSTNDALGTVGGDVPSVLNLTVSNTGSFGTFAPGVAQAYNTALAASVTTTTGDATLSVTDPSTTATGHLVNGTYSLPQALTVRALGLGDSASTAFTPLSETAGTPVVLKSWSAPMTAAPVTLGFRQNIGNTDVLRAGTYSKTVTFTLSTATP